jgi:predicted DNA-binding protein (MmcQ/YjbR family)
MAVEWVRKVCLSLPHATDNVQWGNNLVFKVAGKIFAMAELEPAPKVLSFKVTPEEYAELIEQQGIVPAPYLAKNFWVALETWEAMPRRELEGRLRRSYELVFAKLPKKKQAALKAATSS